MAEYTFKNFYQGGYDAFKPTYGNVFTGYRVAVNELGMTTDPRTANQLQALSQSLNQGAIPVEVGVLQPEAFDKIPKQHFEEMGRVAKLTGAKVSVHAPLIEPSGMGEQGWSEAGQRLAERQLTEVIEKTAAIDKKGNIPVTIHSAGIPGAEYQIGPDGKKIAKLVIVDRESGKPAQVLEGETLHYPSKDMMRKWKPGVTREQKIKVLRGELPEAKYADIASLEKGKFKTPEERLEIMNNSQWDNQISQIMFNKERADEILQQNNVQIQHLIENLNKGEVDPNHLTPSQKQAWQHFENVRLYLDDTRQSVEGFFNKAWKYGDEHDRERLKELSSDFQKHLEKDSSPMGQSVALNKLMVGLREDVHPRLFQPVEEFAIEKSSETFANVAFNSYKKFGENTPIISIENLYPGMAFSLKQEGKEGLPGMNELISKSKEKFVNRAISQGISEDEARKQADKVIGMTLDVGHLNIAKKHGFKDEDLRKEVEAIAKHVKHVHVTDNFGYSDSHLPPGMGNVPIKEIMQELEKTGFKGRKILEVGGWFEHFKTSPYQISLEAMGSPIYAMDMAPYWNQSVGFQQGYSSGYGMMLPQINYETFGAGFSQLPFELGGQRGGAGGSRMSGTPME